MKFFKILVCTFMLLFAAGFAEKAAAQSAPVLFFCEYYGDDGEVGISDRFTTGHITVMAKSSSKMGLRDCSIQYDRYNDRTGEFEYYKKFDFVLEPDQNYVYFEKTENNDMAFDDPGFYRVFLLDSRGRTVTSSLIEIIDK